MSCCTSSRPNSYQTRYIKGTLVRHKFAFRFQRSSSYQHYEIHRKSEFSNFARLWGFHPYFHSQIFALALTAASAKPQLLVNYDTYAASLGLDSLTETLLRPPLILTEETPEIGPLGVNAVEIIERPASLGYNRPLVQHLSGALVPIEDPAVIALRAEHLRAKAVAVAHHGEHHYAHQHRALHGQEHEHDHS